LIRSRFPLYATTAVLAFACGPSRPKAASAEFPTLAAAEHRWSIGLASDGNASGRDIALIDDHDLVVVGSFEQSLTVAGRVLHSAGESDGFVARLAPGGELLWLKRLGGVGHDGVQVVAADAQGRVAFAGLLSDGATLDAATLLPSAVPPDRPTAFVASLDADGTLRWLKLLRSTTYASIADLAFAADGSLIAVGYFGGTLQIDERRLSSAGAHDAVVARFGKEGALLWARRAGGTGADQAHAVAVSGERLLVVGGFAVRAQFGSEVLESQGGGQDAFVVSLDQEGGVTGVESHGGEGNDAAFALAVGATGAYCVAGSFSGAATFGGAELQSRGESDVFVGCYRPDDTHIWSRSLGGPRGDRAQALGLHAGHVVVAGTFAEAGRFAGETLTSTGAHDVFAVKLTVEGEPVWARGFGSAGQESVGGVVVDSTGGVAIAGTFARRISFGGEEIAARGMLDGFAARFMQ